MARTAAIVEMVISDNATWDDAFQFGDEDDTTWTFDNQSFSMDVKTSSDETEVLLALTTANGRIVVDDTDLRILHFHVPDTDVQDTIPFIDDDGCSNSYVYDLIMTDDDSGDRLQLMTGKVRVTHGITGD